MREGEWALVVVEYLFGRGEIPDLFRVRLIYRMSSKRQAPSPYLHDSPAIFKRHGDALFFLKCNAPNGLSLGDELPDQLACFEIPDFYSPVTSAAYDTRVVKLQARHTIIVCSQAVDGAESLQRPYPDGPIAASGDKSTSAHLKLSN